MKKMFSKLLCWGMVVSIILSSFLAVPVMAEENIKVLLNGTELVFDVPPQIIEDRTMVPMRKIFEALGADIDWNDDTKTVTATKDGIIVKMQIDNAVITVNGEAVTFDVPPQLVNDRTLVPVRAVAEGLNADVAWDSDTQTVIITKEEKPVKPARYPEEGLLYGYGNDGIAELQYNARYLFEQTGLPEIIFEYEKETIDYINTENISKMKENILSIWESAAANVIFNDAKLSGENPKENDADAFWALADERRPLYGLEDKHIVNVSMEKIDADTSAIVVELLDTDWAMLSTYVGIAYNKTMGLKYFTLEKSMDFADNGNVPYMFCHVEVGSRGSYYSIQKNKQAFVNAIKDIMSPSAPINPDGSAMINNVKCTLKVTVSMMDFGGNSGKAETEEGTPTTVGVSVFNDKGENITSQLYFGKIEISKDSEVVTGNIDKKSDSVDHAYKFLCNWNTGEYVDITVEVTDENGNVAKLGANKVKIWNAKESLQNLLGPGVNIEIK